MRCDKCDEVLYECKCKEKTMNKEQQELLNEAYKNYQTEWLKENPPFSGPYTNKCLTQEEFINKIKTDPEFSEKWGLKIEERELIEKERYQIFDERGYEFMMNNWSKEEQYNKAGIPTKLITVKYNDTTIESYE
jgi:hypothetical protein